MEDFSGFAVGDLYVLYQYNIVPDESLGYLYAELTRRGENSATNPILLEIEQKLLNEANNFDFHQYTDGQSNNIENSGTHRRQPDVSNTTSTQHGEGRRYTEIVSEETRNFKRFGMQGKSICFKFLHITSSNPMKYVKEGLDEILRTVTVNIKPEDYVGLVFESTESPDRPVGVSFRRRSQISAEVIMNIVSAVNQSNAAFFAGGILKLRLHHVKLPTGTGRNRHLSRLEYNSFVANKRSVIRVKNNDNFCLAYALVLAMAHAAKSSDLKRLLHNDQYLKNAALELCTVCNVNLDNGADYGHIRQFQNSLPRYTIIVYNNRQGRSTYFEGDRHSEKIVLNLFFNDNHFDVITSLTGFFTYSYFCELCKYGYSNNNMHGNCPYKCSACHASPRCTSDAGFRPLECRICRREFKSKVCFDRHTTTVCNKLRRCMTCDENVWVHKTKKHMCGFKFCTTCKQILNVNHLCFMQPNQLTESKREELQNKFLFMFFDIEARQETRAASRPGYLHEANLLVSQQVCKACLNNDNMNESCENCGVRQQIFRGDNCIDQFLNYVARLVSLKKFNITAMAHNMKGYDGCFILKGLFSDIGRWNPKIIRTGLKIISITCGNSLRFIDSLNYMPLALSKLPATFKFDDVKGYFPYLFNTRDNQNYTGPLPNTEYYAIDEMSACNREKFLKWYNTQVENNVQFNMAEENVRYCVGDVNILRKACIIFRECFLTSNNVDPFQESTTIASACNLVFRRNFLKSNTIGIMPKGGYRLSVNQSAIALKWLFWLERSLNIDICHSGNGREVRLKEGIRVDGFSERTNTVYQFHGCFYHGCEKCFPNQVESLDDDTEFGKAELMFNRREWTQRIDKRIKNAGYNLVIKWECEFRAELKTSEELKHFVSDNSELFIKEPLNPRDSFFGGRTNAVKLYHKAESGEKICYLDVCSLYPFVNKYGKYPIGHPKIIIGDNECSQVDIRTAEGLVKCTVLPPRGLYHPVLPYRSRGKLTFPLCRSCVDIQNQDECLHTQEERSFTGTFVADELRKAVEKKYIILKVHEYWEYSIEQYDPETKSGGLFTGYVNNFLKQKVENSGWPVDCKTDAEKSTYLESYNLIEGIKLDRRNITHNAGLRYNSKLMLNSFWGKFGQRENMMQSSIISDPKEFFKLLTDPSVVVHDVLIFSDEVLLAVWDRPDEDPRPIPTVSVAIAAYTTAGARLELYKYLERLGRRVLYFDTDSIIFTQRAGEDNPETGNFLGQLTDEIEGYGPGSYINEFVSGGPKNYAFNVFVPGRNCECDGFCINSCKNVTVCKVKGITLNYKNSQIINFQRIRDMIINPLSTSNVTVHSDRKIIRTTNYELISAPQDKTYRINYTKRRRMSDSYDTLPYGF